MYEETKVIDSRDTEDLRATRRRRECLRCKKRFTTYERVENINLMVVKKDKRIEAFDRDKLMKGILKACEKRPVNISDIEKMVDEIEYELREQKGVEVSSKLIGELVMTKLKKIDKVAYIRFASVYHEFKDTGQFIEEVKQL